MSFFFAQATRPTFLWATQVLNQTTTVKNVIQPAYINTYLVHIIIHKNILRMCLRMYKKVIPLPYARKKKKNVLDPPSQRKPFLNPSRTAVPS